MSKVFGQKGVKVSSYGKENIGCMLYGVGLRRPYIRPFILEQEKGLGPTVVGPLPVDLYGRWEALYGAIPIWLGSSGEGGWRNADKKVNCDGPEKEAAAICGAFVRHTPLFHP